MTLSWPQQRMLASVRDFGDPYHHVHGLSMHGGASQTLDSLVNKGLLERKQNSAGEFSRGIMLTDAGREAIDKLWPAQ